VAAIDVVVNGWEHRETVELNTPVCTCAGYGRVIHVDADAAGGYNNGTSWANAYLDLQDALAEACACDQIWVAQGVYKPTTVTDPNSLNYSFTLPATAFVYGGFDGHENRLPERNWLEHQTILSGAAGYGVNHVVTADGVDRHSVLDGVVVAGGRQSGLRCHDASPTITHNQIRQNHDGILVEGSTSAPSIANNWLYDNIGSGVCIEQAHPAALVRNNTFVRNAGAGVYVFAGAGLKAVNCIVQKTSDPNDLVNCTPEYCCLQEQRYLYDPADPNSVNRHNINLDPLFVNANGNDFHLRSDSPGVNAGDPLGDYLGERDIDGYPRVMDPNNNAQPVADMGAHELGCGQLAHAADFDYDGYVDLGDLAELSAAWLTEPPALDPDFDLNADQIIDVKDLALFADAWLWCACWRPEEAGWGMMGMGMGGAGESTLPALSAEASLSASPTATTALARTAPAIASDIDQLEEGIAWLVETWLADPDLQAAIPEADLKDFLNRLYDSLEELRQEYQAATPTSPPE